MKKIILVFILAIIAVVPQCTQVKQEIKVPATWPTLNKSEVELKQYFDDNMDKLDPIEGIYSVKTAPYRLAIVNREQFNFNNEPSYDFIAIIIESGLNQWTKGRIKAYFRKTARDNYYECKWFNADYTQTLIDYSISNEVYLTDFRTSLLRTYPIKHIKK